MKNKKERVAVLAEEFSALVTMLRALHAGQGVPPSILFELSMAQFRTLMVILVTGGAPSRGLAERLRIGASAVTPLVDKLVEQGFARREDDPADRRISWIRPTAEAQALYEKLVSINQAAMTEIFEDLTIEEIAEVQRGFSLFSAAAKRRVEAQRSALSAASNPNKEKEGPR